MASRRIASGENSQFLSSSVIGNRYTANADLFPRLLLRLVSYESQIQMGLRRTATRQAQHTLQQTSCFLLRLKRQQLFQFRENVLHLRAIEDRVSVRIYMPQHWKLCIRCREQPWQPVPGVPNSTYFYAVFSF